MVSAKNGWEQVIAMRSNPNVVKLWWLGTKNTSKKFERNGVYISMIDPTFLPRSWMIFPLDFFREN
jgi:hypothetical protein